VGWCTWHQGYGEIMFSNCDDGKGNVYSLEYSSVYGSGTMLFYNVNSAAYWTGEFIRGGARVTLRKLCKRHSSYNNSSKFGKCCRILETA
jgi:hypothetical protein